MEDPGPARMSPQRSRAGESENPVRIKIMEKDPARLQLMAQDFGVKAPKGQDIGLVHIAIASAYINEINAETRKALKKAKTKAD